MIDLLYQGGILFTGILTLLLLIVFSMAVIMGLKIFTGKNRTVEKMRHRLTYIKSIGLFALIFGILGQAIGLYEALIAIEKMDSVTPALLAGGLRVSAITSIYGAIIFLLSYLLWFGLEAGLNRQPSDD